MTPEQEALPYAKYQKKPIGEISQENLDAINAGPCDPTLALPIEKRSNMLDPGYQAVETGFCKMPDGSGFAATRVFMPGMTPEMWDWWLNWHCLSDIRCGLWIPNAHTGAYCGDPSRHLDSSGLSMATRNWGQLHFPKEGLMSLEESDYFMIKFYSPEDFGIDRLRLMVSPVKSWCGGSVIGFGSAAKSLWGHYAEELQDKDPNAEIPFNVLFHTVRVVEGGCEMRHRYWLGKELRDGKAYNAPFPEGMDMEMMAWTMCRHSLLEYSNLATILPSLYKEMEGKIDTKYESDFKTPADFQ